MSKQLKEKKKVKNRSIFYIIRPHPTDPNVLKMGKTRKYAHRMKMFRTICPNLSLIRAYNVTGDKEKPAIAFFFSQEGVETLSREIARFPDVNNLAVLADSYFGKKRKVTKP